MSSDGTVKALETTDSGFTITKEISREGGEHIQIELDITSTHDAEATVDIEESLPPGVDHAQIGFLPNHEPSQWDIDEPGSLTLQARLMPEGTRQIIYGLRDIEPDEADPLANELRATAIGGPAGEEVDIDSPGAEPDAAETTDAVAEPESETASESEPVAEGEPDDDEPGAAGDQGGTTTQAADGGSAAAAGSLEPPLDEGTAAALADELQPHLEGDGADAVTETKLTQLQEDVADMRVYLPAFEEFLGENGRANDIAEGLEDLRERLDQMEESPEELEEIVADLDDRLSDLEAMAGDLEEIKETTEGLDERLAAITNRLEALEDWRDDIADVSE